MRKKELAKLVIERLKEEYPESHCSLDYDDAWKLLVSVRLAAQCTDARVNVVVQDLFCGLSVGRGAGGGDPGRNRKICPSVWTGQK